MQTDQLLLYTWDLRIFIFLELNNNWPVRKNEDGKYMYDVNVKSHLMIYLQEDTQKS